MSKKQSSIKMEVRLGRMKFRFCILGSINLWKRGCFINIPSELLLSCCGKFVIEWKWIKLCFSIFSHAYPNKFAVQLFLPTFLNLSKYYLNFSIKL